ncbi:MAG: hypothetical protein LBO71_07855 [Prevotellaceae bacterium]|jgi:hypothetical protein|nr:hypothetical protein [Prevotellaceae bacterium]
MLRTSFLFRQIYRADVTAFLRGCYKNVTIAALCAAAQGCAAAIGGEVDTVIFSSVLIEKIMIIYHPYK